MGRACPTGGTRHKSMVFDIEQAGWGCLTCRKRGAKKGAKNWINGYLWPETYTFLANCHPNCHPCYIQCIRLLSYKGGSFAVFLSKNTKYVSFHNEFHELDEFFLYGLTRISRITGGTLRGCREPANSQQPTPNS